MASLPKHVDLHGSSYRIRIRMDGEMHTRSLPAEAVEEEAEVLGLSVNERLEELATDWKKELREDAKRRRRGLPGIVRFSALVKRYRETQLPRLAESSQASYTNVLDAADLYFGRLGDPALREVTGGDVEGYLDWRRLHGPDGTERSKPLSPTTLQQDRAILHRLFELAEKWELRDGNPVSRTDRPKSDSRDPVILTEEQFGALLAQCEKDPFLRLYALTLAETGMRSESEALWLQWQDVDLEEGFLWVASGRDGHRTKTGDGRWVPLTPRLRAALRDHAALFRMATYRGKRSPWVFHHVTKNRGRKAGDRINSMRRGLQAAAERAKLPKEWVPHDLRHRRVTTWLADGQSPVLVKEAVGHAQLATTMRYTHLAKEHLRSLVDEEDGHLRIGEAAS